MSMPPPRAGLSGERIQADWEHDPAGIRVRISVEGYDEKRGWCAIDSISFPQHQLPLLEQALAEMKSSSPGEDHPGAKIIPFPGGSPARGQGRDHQARI